MKLSNFLMDVDIYYGAVTKFDFGSFNDAFPNALVK
jgi:hypothetical protein